MDCRRDSPFSRLARTQHSKFESDAAGADFQNKKNKEFRRFIQQYPLFQPLRSTFQEQSIKTWSSLFQQFGSTCLKTLHSCLNPIPPNELIPDKVAEPSRQT